MDIAKAIEILELKGKSYPLLSYPDVSDALKLGIEALKREKAERHNHAYRATLLLPGETEGKGRR